MEERGRDGKGNKEGMVKEWGREGERMEKWREGKGLGSGKGKGKKY